MWEKGYIERLSPGRFALYRITSLGEEQVKGEGEGEKELGGSMGTEETKKEVEEIEGYECVSCGTAVKENTTVCPKCGIVFEEVVEEEEAAEALDSSQDEPCEEAPSPAPQSPKVDEEDVVKETDNAGGKTGILDHPSVPDDWKTCNWKWK
ncbi:MAG: hypothetical protein AB1393_02100 [Candidatus Edwardsbacteria bacterium]